MSAYSAHQYTRTNNPGMISRGPVVLCSAYGVVDQIGERCTHRTGMRVSRAGSSSSRAQGDERGRETAHVVIIIGRRRSSIQGWVRCSTERISCRQSGIWIYLNFARVRNWTRRRCVAQNCHTLYRIIPQGATIPRNGVEAARSPQMD